MKKFIYSLVLCALAAMPAVAQETLTVYDGEATSAYVPVYGFYADAYQKIDMVMPAEDLSELQGATLTKLTWYLTTPAAAAWAGNFQIYLMEVDYATPTAYADVANATLVFEGPLDGTGETLEIEFANDYAYDGGNLLIAVRQTELGAYKSATFAGQEATGAALQGYSYSSLEAVNMNVRDFLPKTTFEFVPSSGVVYYKPKNLQVEAGVNDAVLTWDAGSDETSWSVEYKKAADEEWIAAGTVTERTYTFDALENGVKYDVRVKAIYADGESGWVQTSFATLACEETDMGEVEYTLTDTYGDGWNGGGKLQIFLAGTDVLVQELQLPNGSGNSELSGTFKLCYGVDYDLVWVAGTYNYENGFILIGPEGETIAEFQGTGKSGDPVPTPGVLTTFQIHMNTCPRPTDVVASNITYNGATITWTPGTEEQDLWQLIYAKGEFDPDALDMIPIDVNEPTYALTGLEENSTYSVYVRSKCSDEEQSRWSKVCTFATPLQFSLPEDLTVTNITKNSAEANWTGDAQTYNLRYRPYTALDESFEAETLPAGWTVNNWVLMPIAIYTMGGTPLAAADGGSCIASISVDDSGSSLVDIDVDNWLITQKVDLGGTLEFYVGDLGEGYTENFSVYVSTTGTATSDFTVVAENQTTAGAMVTDASAWAKKEFDLSAYEGQQGYVAIRHHGTTGDTGYYLFVDAVKINNENVGAEWIVVENTTSPVTMVGLEPGTTYECQVQGIFDEGNSQWIESVLFTTTAADAMPAEVTVDNITATTADVNVIGSQDTYNIRYRTAGIYPGYEEGFEYGLASGEFPTESGWITIDADGDGYAWYTFTPDDNTNQYVYDASCMTSASYMGGALTPDDWLISPALDLGGTLSFMVRGQDPSYAAEHYAVYVSTGERTDLTSYVELIPESVSGTVYEEITADLSDYEGQTGYIAIRHFNCTDEFRLNIDNFKIISTGDVVEPGEWQVVENVNSIYTIEGLTPETKYEVQVQGIVDEQNTTEWTKSEFFTTLPSEGITEFYLVGDFNEWNQTEEGGRIAFTEVEDGVFEAKADLAAGVQFKIITFDEEGNTVWFGGTDETGVGYYLITEELLEVPTALFDGSNFKMEDAAVYIIRITEADGTNGVVAPLQVEFIYYAPTAIDNITVDKNSNDWYNLNGQKLNGKPTVPGVYINGNKKVVIK